MIVAFLGSGLHYVSERTDAALFDTKEEAQELMKKAELNGICNTIPDFAKMTVSSDTQVLLQHWHSSHTIPITKIKPSTSRLSHYK